MNTTDYISPKTVTEARGDFAEAVLPQLTAEAMLLLIELDRRSSLPRRSVERGDYDRRQS